MIEVLKQRLNELELELKEQEFTHKDDEEVELKVAEYKQKLIDELIASKEEKAKTINAKIDEVNNLIRLVETQPIAPKVVEEVNENLPEEAQEFIDEVNELPHNPFQN